jgi:hypothetical protein
MDALPRRPAGDTLSGATRALHAFFVLPEKNCGKTLAFFGEKRRPETGILACHPAEPS